MNEETAKSLTVDKLKVELKNRGIVFGPKDKKADLLNKLLDNLVHENINTLSPDYPILSKDKVDIAEIATVSNNHNDDIPEKEKPVNEHDDITLIKDNNDNPSSSSSEDNTSPPDISSIEKTSNQPETLIENNEEEEKASTLAIIDHPKEVLEVSKENKSIDDSHSSNSSLIETKEPELLVESITSTAVVVKDIVNTIDTHHILSPSEPEPTTSTAVSSITTVRIDNFQRPLQITSLIPWLEEMSGCDKGYLKAVTFDSMNTNTQNVIRNMGGNIWLLLPLRTHCYVDFPSLEMAERCMKNVIGKQFPVTSTLKLTASIASIRAEDAPGSTIGKMSPIEYAKFINKSTSTTTTPASANKRTVTASATATGVALTAAERRAAQSIPPNLVIPTAASVDVLRKVLNNTTGNNNNSSITSATITVAGSPRGGGTSSINTINSILGNSNGNNTSAVGNVIDLQLITGNFEQGFTTRKHRQQQQQQGMMNSGSLADSSSSNRNGSSVTVKRTRDVIIEHDQDDEQQLSGQLADNEEKDSAVTVINTTSTATTAANADKKKKEGMKRMKIEKDENIISSTNTTTTSTTAVKLNESQPPKQSQQQQQQSLLAMEAEAVDENQEDELTLDELFRKTISKPQLYWLPCEIDVVKRRQLASKESGIAYAQTRVMNIIPRDLVRDNNININNNSNRNNSGSNNHYRIIDHHSSTTTATTTAGGVGMKTLQQKPISSAPPAMRPPPYQQQPRYQQPPHHQQQPQQQQHQYPPRERERHFVRGPEQQGDRYLASGGSGSSGSGMHMSGDSGFGPRGSGSDWSDRNQLLPPPQSSYTTSSTSGSSGGGMYGPGNSGSYNSGGVGNGGEFNRNRGSGRGGGAGGGNANFDRYGPASSSGFNRR